MRQETYVSHFATGVAPTRLPQNPFVKAVLQSSSVTRADSATSMIRSRWALARAGFETSRQSMTRVE